ncbi:MAG: hypothetical protein ACI9BW_002018 [Gammaproteobacteria bacterium]|jgi:hypothetical protein
MTKPYGKLSKSKTPSPSSSKAVAAAIAACPHNNLLPPPSPEIAETARRAAFYGEVRDHLEQGLLGHEILALFPQEEHWMHQEMSLWEVIFRREQIDFIENLDKPAPKFTAGTPKPKLQAVVNDYLPPPELAIDNPDKKAVAIKATVWRSDTGEGVEELVWFPRSQIKDGKASAWITGLKRKELEEKYPVASITNFPE